MNLLRRIADRVERDPLNGVWVVFIAAGALYIGLHIVAAITS